MVEVEVSDMGNGRNLFRKPKPSMSEIHQMTEGTEYSPVRDHSWKKGTLEGLRLNQKLEKGLMEDGEEARILKFQGREREVLTQSGHKRGSQKSSKKNGTTVPFPKKYLKKEPHICPELLRTTWAKFTSSTEHCRSSYWKRSLRHWMKVGYAKKSFLYKPQFARTHTQERDALNAISAPKVFMRSSDLQAHQQIHAGKKPYHYELCTKEFTHYSTLCTHLKIHRKKKPYQHEDFKKSFSHKENLNIHGQTHSGLKQHPLSVGDF